MNENLILLRHAQVYAPKYLGRRDVLLGGGHILAMEANLTPELGLPNVQEIDASGMLAIPGVIDQHVHITGGGGERGFSSRVPELSSVDLLSCGVTTVVGVLGTDSVTRSVHNLVAKTKALREEGLSAYCLTGAYDLPSPTITGSVKNDIVYIQEILGVKVAIADHRSAQPTCRELTRLAAQVRLAALTAGKPGVVHIHTGCGKRGLGLLFDCLEKSDLPIQQFRPTHVENVLDDAVRFAKMGGWVDFTADTDEEITAKNLLAAIAQGMPWEMITMSSDAGGSIPVWNEKKEMVGMDIGRPDTLLRVVRCLRDSHGVALEHALGLITAAPARALGLPGKGCLQPGAAADIVLTDNNMQIQAVYAMGRLLWRNETSI